MCVGVEYFQDGEPVTVYVTQRNAHLPVRLRGGPIKLLMWGAPPGAACRALRTIRPYLPIGRCPPAVVVNGA